MRFNAGAVSQKRVMELISSASDTCILYGICACLGKLQPDDLESRQNSASIVDTPRVSERASLSRALDADDLSDYAWLAVETSTRASTVDAFTNSKD